MVVPIPIGSHFLEIRFEDTPVRKIGGLISLVSLLIWLGLMVLGRRKKGPVQSWPPERQAQ